MCVEIVTPDAYLGGVTGDLSSRRGIISEMEVGPSGKVVRSLVPLSEMFGYATTLRSATQGRATYSMEFKSYKPAPINVADVIVRKAS